MRILLVAYNFPPLNNAQSIRWYYLVNMLGEMGYKIDVLTIKLPNEFRNINNFSIHENVRILRVFPGFFEYFSQKIKNSMGVYSGKDIFIRQSIRFSMLKNIYTVFKYASESVVPAGIRVEWLPFVFKFIYKMVDVLQYSVVITSQEPLVDSLVGFVLKKRYKSDIWWISDIGDPAFSVGYSRWRSFVDGLVEKLIVKNSDRVIMTNNSIVPYFIKKYGLRSKKIKVITQGFCCDIRNHGLEGKDDDLILFFGGTFYDGFREPYNLFKAVESVKGVKLIVAGSNEKFIKCVNQDKVKFVGVVPHTKLLKMEEEADVLVNISNKHSYQIAGKIFEYLGAKRPILNITYNNEDETSHIIKGLKVGIVCKNDVADIKKAIENLKIMKKKKQNFDFNNPLINNFCWKAKAKQVEELLNEKNIS